MSTLPARLRPYQRHAIEAIDEAVAHGHRPLIVAPTGSGETWMLAESVSPSLGRKERVLVLVHQEELLENLVKQIQVAEPEVGLSIEQATRYADQESKVVVGSIPTLAHPKAQRRLDRLGRFDRVYVDEAHLAAAASYLRLFRSLGTHEPGGPSLIGFTATPNRGDGRGVGAALHDGRPTRSHCPSSSRLESLSRVQRRDGRRTRSRAHPRRRLR